MQTRKIDRTIRSNATLWCIHDQVDYIVSRDGLMRQCINFVNALQVGIKFLLLKNEFLHIEE